MLCGGRSSQTMARLDKCMDHMCMDGWGNIVIPVVTAGVVPLAINDGHARLLSQATGGSESVGLGETLGTRLGPLVDSDDSDPVAVETHSPVGGQHLDQSGCPEPAIYAQWLVMRSITPIDLYSSETKIDFTPKVVCCCYLGVTQSAGSPDLFNASLVHQSLDKVPLIGLLKRNLDNKFHNVKSTSDGGQQNIKRIWSTEYLSYKVHAAFPAVVSGSEPVPLGVPQHLFIALPTKPVSLALEPRGPNPALSDCTFAGHGETDLALVTVWVHISSRGILGQGDYDNSTLSNIVAVLILREILEILSKHNRGEKTGHQSQQHCDR